MKAEAIRWLAALQRLSAATPLMHGKVSPTRFSMHEGVHLFPLT
jgi:hypothetical protein